MCIACEEKRELEAEVGRLRADLADHYEGMCNIEAVRKLREEIAWLRANDEDHQP